MFKVFKEHYLKDMYRGFVRSHALKTVERKEKIKTMTFVWNAFKKILTE